jgi:hypothetical protein
MSSRKPRPLFSANAPEAYEKSPAESGLPGSLTSRLRRLLLTDAVPLFTAEPESGGA